ncbi:hypothetical protein [Nesterenkonia muleiensis]|uniref:hypothetical protein n=1 Tax=Nesterenkonia muleiensis TaxID=2282648 RepID=UPI000E75BBDD|nr:hypothetical protein [Nesterenkonia muleiensis]
MTDHSDRVEELIAAAAASDLSAQEQAEFDALRAQDPTIDATLHELMGLLPGLQAAVPHWEEAEPPQRLDASIRSITESGVRSETVVEGNGAPAASASEKPLSEHSRAQQPRGRRRAAFALVAAGSVIAGSGATLTVQHLIDSPPDGPPGTYGAVEEITFLDEPGEVSVDGSLIAHTWGTETVLEIEGLEPGSSFTVVLVAEDGQEFASGTFFGSEVLIECRMNAAIMRDEVERVEITAEDGNVITWAELPSAIDPEAEDTGAGES